MSTEIKAKINYLIGEDDLLRLGIGHLMESLNEKIDKMDIDDAQKKAI
jgi:regulator of replication initiation timing